MDQAGKGKEWIVNEPLPSQFLPSRFLPDPSSLQQTDCEGTLGSKERIANPAKAEEKNVKAKERTAKVKEATAKVKDETAKEQTFVWTDDEVELLLKVTYEFKVKKAAKNVDWESVRSKYGDIWDEFKLQMPSSPDKAKETGKDFPYKPEQFTKQALSSKLKAVWLK